jgi:hypothetical protein
MDSKHGIIDLIYSVLGDTGRCARLVAVILAFGIAAGLGLHIWL